MELEMKLNRLRKIIGTKDSVLVAFSGGVDSSLIAKIAFEELGERVLAVTISSDVYARRELAIAERVAAEIGVAHKVVNTSELENPRFTANPVDRCYHCKQEEIETLSCVAESVGMTHIAFGVNMSDFGEHRPGIKALREAGFFLPLVEAGIYKEEIAAMAKSLGLSNHDLPSTTCLASRIPYGETITREKLVRTEKAESLLYSLGLRQTRVRIQDTTARIEVAQDEINTVIQHRDRVIREFKVMGYDYVTLDLEGYRSGSMNEILENYPRQ